VRCVFAQLTAAHAETAAVKAELRSSEAASTVRFYKRAVDKAEAAAKRDRTRAHELQQELRSSAVLLRHQAVALEKANVMLVGKGLVAGVAATAEQVQQAADKARVDEEEARESMARALHKAETSLGEARELAADSDVVRLSEEVEDLRADLHLLKILLARHERPDAEGAALPSDSDSEFSDDDATRTGAQRATVPRRGSGRPPLMQSLVERGLELLTTRLSGKQVHAALVQERASAARAAADQGQSVVPVWVGSDGQEVDIPEARFWNNLRRQMKRIAETLAAMEVASGEELGFNFDGSYKGGINFVQSTLKVLRPAAQRSHSTTAATTRRRSWRARVTGRA
jgi:hypothetical protein